MVRRGDGAIEHGPCLLVPLLFRVALREPERARDEGAFVACEPIFAGVSQDQAIAVQTVADGVGGTDHPLIAIVDEVDSWQQQHGSVEVLVPERLNEGAALAVIALLEDRVPYLLASPFPALDRGRAHARLRQP